MNSTFNKIIISLLPLVPKFLIKLISNRYIAGEEDESALNTIKKLNNKNMSATIDILGEHTQSIQEANKITQNYISLYKQIWEKKLDCNISIKPSHIGSDISEDIYRENLNKIHKEATKQNNFLRIDMENSLMTDITIKTFKEEYNLDKNIGIVIQAYLHRSLNDIQKLDTNMNIRLCKGIYNESEKISIKNPKKINENYLKLLKYAFENDIYVGIATHDIKLINEILDLIDNMDVEKNKFEFQVLYGVPMGKMLKKLINKSFKVRVYVPYGKNWYEYSLRRLKENPNIALYVIKNLFSKNFYK